MSQSPETTDKKEATMNYTVEKINGKTKITVYTYNNKTYKELVEEKTTYDPMGW